MRTAEIFSIERKCGASIEPKSEEAIPIRIKVKLRPKTIKRGRSFESSLRPVMMIGISGRIQGERTLKSPPVNENKSVGEFMVPSSYEHWHLETEAMISSSFFIPGEKRSTTFPLASRSIS